MRNAALVLGIIAGIWGMFVGFFGWGYTEAIERYGEIDNLAEQVNNVQLVREVVDTAAFTELDIDTLLAPDQNTRRITSDDGRMSFDVRVHASRIEASVNRRSFGAL